MSHNGALLQDTHVWFRYQVDSRMLRAQTADLIDQAVEQAAVYVSVIAIWELAMLERDGRLQLQGGISRWIRDALAKAGIDLLPLTSSVVIESVALPEPMHKDPADRFLVASARIE